MKRTHALRGQWLRRPMLVAVAVVALGLVMTAQPAEANAHLWLYPSTDNPAEGGYVIDTPSFTLMVENHADGSPQDNTAYGVYLAFAVNDVELFDSAALTLPDGTVVSIGADDLQGGTPTQPCSGSPMPPHGVYPAEFTTVALGDLAAEEIAEIAIDIVGDEGLEAHFDAIAIGYKANGQGVVRCYDVVNPFGHGVTVAFGGSGEGDCHQIEVSKEASATGVDLDDQAEFTITVTSTGTCDLTEATLVDTVPTVETDDGVVPAFTVLSTDPEADTQDEGGMTWSIGAMAPGESFVVTLNVVFDQPAADGSLVVNSACAGAAELDEPVCDEAAVAVGEVADDVRGPGFWCNQIRFALEGRDNAWFTVEDLEGWLTEIDGSSAVFSEMWDITSLDAARDVLCYPNQAESQADRLARHLLCLWLNVTSGRLDPEATLGDLTAGDVPAPDGMDPEMTIADVLSGAEQAVLDGADEATLAGWAELVDFVNNASTGVQQSFARSQRVRRGH